MSASSSDATFPGPAGPAGQARPAPSGQGPPGLRRLGAHGPLLPAIGLGCMGMTGFYGQPDDEESIRTLHRALDLGCGFWDTSDAYRPHVNERLLARVLATRRSEVFIATKFGVTVDPRTLRRSVDGSPANVRRSCDASLKRLGVDHIDLYYAHRVDPSVPIEETAGAMAELVQAGKVRRLGLSEPGADTIRKAHAAHPITAVQIEYSLWTRDVEAAVLPQLRELGIGLVAYAPLGHGFLTGCYRDPRALAEGDFRRSQPRFAEQNLTRNLVLIERIGHLAAAKGITTAQLALAWVLHQGDDIIPIVGTKRVRYLEEDLAAAQVHLSAGELTRIDATVPQPAGERYDPAGMAAVGV